MTREELEKVVEEEFPQAVPEKFHHLISNVAFLIEEEPDEETRREHGLEQGDTLLGLYRGIPHTERGGIYGVGMTMPDTITLYAKPLHDEAQQFIESGAEADFSRAMRRAVRETIWHEVAHYFGMDEHQVNHREHLREHGPDEECESCSA